MIRISWYGLAALAAAAAAACCGCGAQQQAKMLVVPARWPGQIMEVCAGGSKNLTASGRITLQRKVKVEDGTEIDVWVIASRLSDKKADNQGGFFETKLTRGTVVLLHPLLAGKSWFLPLGEELADRGWDVVLMDCRGYGFSGGDYTTWGAREKKDVKAVMDTLLAELAISDSIYVCGSSLGAGVAIQYAAIDPRCKGVIAMAPPGDLMGVFRRILLFSPQAKFEESVRQAGKLAGFDPAEASTVAAARKLTCPVVVIRGGLDLVIPTSQCEAVFSAVDTPKKLVTVSFSGPWVEMWRDDWLANQMDGLAAMRGEKPVPAVAMRPAARPDEPPAPARPSAAATAAPRVGPADSGRPTVAVAAPRVAPTPVPSVPPAATAAPTTIAPAVGITMVPDRAQFPEADRP
jgi:pimeloyl-ACP methyl ester carboxylesterase